MELRQRKLTVPIDGYDPEQMRGAFYQGRTGHIHHAADLLAPRYTPVRAVEDGTIGRLFESVAGGLTIYQKDRSGRFVYYYAHLESYAAGLKDGDTVKRGQVIGFVGTSGNAPPNTPHLHFAISSIEPGGSVFKGKALDPYEVYTTDASFVGKGSFESTNPGKSLSSVREKVVDNKTIGNSSDKKIVGGENISPSIKSHPVKPKADVSLPSVQYVLATHPSRTRVLPQTSQSHTSKSTGSSPIKTVQNNVKSVWLKGPVKRQSAKPRKQIMQVFKSQASRSAQRKSRPTSSEKSLSSTAKKAGSTLKTGKSKKPSKSAAPRKAPSVLRKHDKTSRPSRKTTH